jgi:hypothetical protein
MEQQGSGSDPHTLRQAGDPQCAHCGTLIVDETTMTTRDDQAYCCVNCERAMQQAPAGTMDQPGKRSASADRSRGKG